MERIKKHFSLKKIPTTQEDPMLFVVSQWQTNKSEPGFLYLMYRFVPATFFLTTWCIKVGTPNWIIFLSMWGYTLCTLQALIGFLLSLAATLTVTLWRRPDIGRTFLRMHPLYWVINVTATTVGYLISTIHWCFLFKGKSFKIMDFFIHGINSIYLTTDLILAGHPVRIIHVIYPFTFAAIYAIFGIFYYFYDKKRGGSGYVYPIMDWDYPASTAFVVLGIGFLIIFFHLLTYVIYLLKIRTYNRMYKKIDTQNDRSEGREIEQNS